MVCKYCRESATLNFPILRGMFDGEIPPYLEGRIDHDTHICRECVKILEKGFVYGLELRDLPLYINFVFMFTENQEHYLNRLKSAQ